MTESNGTREGLLHRRFTRREALRVAAVGGAGLVVSGALGACASTTPPTAPTSAAPTTSVQLTPAAEAAGVVAPKAARGELPQQTIVVAFFSGPDADSHKRLAPKFEEYSKGRVKVVVEDLGRGAPMTEKWQATMMAKSDAWDVVWFRTLQLVRNVNAGFFAPLDTFMNNPELLNAKAFDYANDYPESLQSEWKYNDKIWGFPQEFVIFLTAYRKDLLQKYGIPEPPAAGWSWEDILEASVKLKQGFKADGLGSDVYPLTMMMKKGQNAGHAAVSLLWGNGVEWFDDKAQKPQFYQPDAVEAVGASYDWLWKNEFLSPANIDWEFTECQTAVQNEKAAIACTHFASALTWNDPSKSPAVAGKMGYSFYPAFKKKDPSKPYLWSYSYGSGVSAFSKKQEAAFEYLAWFNSKEICEDRIVNGGGMSGRTSVLTSPAIQERMGPQLKVVVDSMKRAHPLYKTADIHYMVGTALDTEINAIWTKMKSIDDGLKNADAETVKYYRDSGFA